VTILLAVLGGLLGGILGWILFAAAAIMLGNLLGASNFEGALSMQAVFGIGPVGGMLGVALAAWLVVRLRQKRRHATTEGE
jgi:prolipoprotein diacylglyceryltransferase